MPLHALRKLSKTDFAAMPQPIPANNEREAHLRALADQLLFKVERSGAR